MKKKRGKKLNMNKDWVEKVLAKNLRREAWDAHRSHTIHDRPLIQSAIVVATLNNSTTMAK